MTNIVSRIEESELDLIEDLIYPISCAEILFHNFDDFGRYSETRFGDIRHYQHTMLSFESMVDYDAYVDLKGSERFELRKRVGDILNLGARTLGKTCIGLRLNIILSILNDGDFPCAIYSLDEHRLRGVVDYVKKACDFHPVVREWDVDALFHPIIVFSSRKSGWTLKGVNLTLKGKSPAENWYSLHVKKIFGEEVSYEDKKCYEKRVEAVGEDGAVLCLAGMSNITKHSVIGEQFYDWLKKGKSLNLPQFVSPAWNDQKKQDRIKTYDNSEDSIGYRMYVKGEIVEDAVTELDMNRIEEACYKRNDVIKRFEVTKEKFNYYQNIIIVDRPQNAGRIFLAADVGDNHSEILVFSEVGEKYIYLYNITLYKLIKDEQFEIFKFLIKELQANVMGVDCSEAMGRVLCDDLEKAYSKDNVVRYLGQSKLEVDFQKDEKGNIEYKNGIPAYKEEYMAEWSAYLLKKNMYAGRYVIPFDDKLDKQLTFVVSRFSGNRKETQCALEEDHMFNAWKVLEITIFLKKDFNKTPLMTEEYVRGVTAFI